jgi:hypothetical protein
LKTLFDAEETKGKNEPENQKGARAERNTLFADAAESRMKPKPPSNDVISLADDSVILPEADQRKMTTLPNQNSKRQKEETRNEETERALENFKKYRHSK